MTGDSPYREQDARRNASRARGRSEFTQFARSWIRNPRQVSAVAPSSRALANLITADVLPGRGTVLELGPGTGVFTRALIGRGVHERDLVLIESDPMFAAGLSAQFPAADVRCMDASRLVDTPAAVMPGSVVCAVSGLPLLSLPESVVRNVLAGAAHMLAPGGALYQFTYGPTCPVPRRVLDEAGFQATRMGTVIRNLPPASVYRLSRIKGSRH